MNDWYWKVGAMHGFGEVIWQELAGNVRRITKVLQVPNQGLLLMKAGVGLYATEVEPQFDAKLLVVTSLDLNEKLSEEATRAWEGGSIVPVNGTHPRFAP